MIFERLTDRPHGFGELRRAIPSVTAKVLRQQLRQMQADGLLVRRPLVPAAKGVQYQLTHYGRSLEFIFEALWRWGTRHLERPDAARGTVVRPPKAVAG
jgi:DNA-binding HxlR family transcriptional regulator